MDEHNVPGRIRTLREGKHLSQLSFGALINKRPETISRWESGKTTPSLGEMILIADRFKVPLDWFAGVDETPEQRVAGVGERAEATIRGMQDVLEQLLAELTRERSAAAAGRRGEVDVDLAASVGVRKKRVKQASKAVAVPRESAG